MEKAHVSQCVHALPETLELVRHQLALLAQAFQWLAFEDGVVSLDVVDHLVLEHEEAAVDPALADGVLLRERDDGFALDRETPEARRWMDRRDGCESAMRPVECEQLCQVDVRYRVAVSEHECLPSDELGQPTYSAAGHRVEAGVAQVDDPVVRGIAVGLVHPVREADTERARAVPVIQEVVLDELT